MISDFKRTQFRSTQIIISLHRKVFFKKFSVKTLFKISVGDTFQLPFDPRRFTLCAHVRGYLGYHETRYVTCDEPVNGRFVVVYREEKGRIKMCEFEVFGHEILGKTAKAHQC